MTAKSPAAGWYPDPSQRKTRRYWDGVQWTDQRQEAPPAEPVAGWKVAVSVLVAVVLPVLGLIIGIAMLRRRPGAGVLVLVATVIGFLYWLVALL